MAEHVIASVLREAWTGRRRQPRGGAGRPGDPGERRRLRLAGAGGPRSDSARRVLADLQATRENYHMIDDEFQLPVLAARYLADSAVSDARKRAFLLDAADGATPARRTAPRAGAGRQAHPALRRRRRSRGTSSAFRERDSAHWRSASWRDSDAGYAGGRFAMDVNAIWVPQALEATAGILAALRELGFGPEGARLDRAGHRRHAAGRTTSGIPRSLARAVERWRGARRHFEVRSARRRSASAFAPGSGRCPRRSVATGKR